MSIEDALYPLLRAYTASPQWVKSSIGRAYSMVPRTARYGDAYSRARRELARRDPQAIAALASRKLGTAIDWAIRTVPAYREFESLRRSDLSPQEKLTHLPYVSKTELIANLDRYVSALMPAKQRLRTFTGGSTANPMMFYLHRSVTRAREYAYIEDFHRRVGMGERDVILALRGRTVPTAGQPGGRLWMYEPIKRHLILSSDHLEARYMPDYVDALRRWRPSFIQGFPSAIYPLAKWLAVNPAPDVTSRLRGVVLYSENCYHYQLRLFRQVFGCPVLQHYGHSERVLMAATMPDDDRFFFWPQYGHVELRGFDGRPVTRPGELGEIVGTAFDNQVMPFLRYRTGDMGVLSNKPHPLLPGFPAFERIEGRLQEFVVCRDRRLVSITTLGAAHFEQLAGVEAIQYEQHEPGLLRLNVVSDGLSAGAVEAIARAVHDKTQGGCEVQVECVPRIERTGQGKQRMLLQHLDLGGYLAASAEMAEAAP